MLIAILRYLSGYLRIRVTGYSPERFLNLCSHHGIYLWDLSPAGGAYEMNISVRGFRRLRPILRKTRVHTAIRRRRGLPFFLQRYRRRKVFFAGAVLCAALIYALSLFVWNIHIEGNQVRTDETLLAFLESRGVVHGMRLKDVDCAQIVRDIRREYDDIIWVSAYLSGTRLMIQVKENSDSGAAAGSGAGQEQRNEEGVAGQEQPSEQSGAGQEQPPVQSAGEAQEQDTEPWDIVAACDGQIQEIITRRGVPQVHAGDQVKKGDLLVSGNVEIRNDAGEVTGYQYQRAEAQITALTQLDYEDTLPLAHTEKRWTGKKRAALLLETKKRIYRLGGQRNPFSHAVVSTGRGTIRLGEHFDLPLLLGWETVREYRPETRKYTDQELRERLSADFQKFCRELEKKGVQILENDVKIYKETDQAAARGTLTLSQEIGEQRRAGRLTAAGEDPFAKQEGNQ